MIMEQRFDMQSDFKDRTAKELRIEKLKKNLKICSLGGLAGYVILTVFFRMSDGILEKYSVWADRIAGVCWFLFLVSDCFIILLMILEKNKSRRKTKAVFELFAWGGLAGYFIFLQLSVISEGGVNQYTDFFGIVSEICMILFAVSFACFIISRIIEISKRTD